MKRNNRIQYLIIGFIGGFLITFSFFWNQIPHIWWKGFTSGSNDGVRMEMCLSYTDKSGIVGGCSQGDYVVLPTSLDILTTDYQPPIRTIHRF